MLGPRCQSSPPELPESPEPEPPLPDPLEPELPESPEPEPPDCPESSEPDLPEPEPDFPESSEVAPGDGLVHAGSPECSASLHLPDPSPPEPALSEGLGTGERRGCPITLWGARTAWVVAANDRAETKYAANARTTGSSTAATTPMATERLSITAA
jgi:hypothetical protein